MSADDPLEAAVDCVADGVGADWGSLPGRARSGEERQRLEALRIIAAIADVHRSSGGAESLRSIEASQPPAPAAAPTPAAAPPADWKGETWGRFQLLEEVGSGSFGSVYRAWDPDLEVEIAIKILHRHVADVHLKERLLREGRALARVRDPNVVRVLGVESYGERVGLCMEFVHGETLEDVLRRQNTLNAREAILVGQDVCRALTAVHRAGFVHRDVKARNIMRERAGRIVLMDFGTGREAAQLESAAVQRGNIAGTPLYMAPEVLAGHPATPCSDVYGVGVLLYHLVTARYPIEGRSLKDIHAAHMFGKRTPLSDHRSDLPPDFIRVVDRALMADPQQRCSSAGSLLEALAAIGEGHRRRDVLLRTLVNSTLAAAALVIGLTALGAVSSRYFNTAFGRADYVNEGLRDWFTWGAKSVVAPSVLFVIALLSLALLLAVRVLLLRASRRARLFDQACKSRCRAWKLDDVENLSLIALLVSVLTLTAGWWYFSPLIGALIIYPDVSTVSAEQLALLSPQFKPYHETYRACFVWVTIICVMAWSVPLRMAARKQEWPSRGLIAGGAAVIVLAILMLDFPYRMLAQNHLFDVAEWRDNRCYILGQRAGDVLLFCPSVEPPRNRIVSTHAPEFEPLGVQENIFTQFSAAK